MKKILLLCALTTILCSCATPYHKYGNWSGGGYTDLKIQDNIFKVTFGGNGYPNRGEVADFALLRSAEVTIENGYSYFVITKENAWSQVSTGIGEALKQVGTGLQQAGTGVSGITGELSQKEILEHDNLASETRFYDEQTQGGSWPTVSYTIACFMDAPNDINTTVYDAKQVSDNLRATYKIKPKAPQRK